MIYTLSNQQGVQVALADGRVKTFDQLKLDKATSEQLFQRTQQVQYIEVKINK